MKRASFCLVIALLSSGASGQGLLRWNCPYKPSTECWNAQTSVEERQGAVRLGIDMSALTNEELTTMEHPFCWSCVFHDSPTDGFGFAANGLNGFQESLDRKDALETLLGIHAREDFYKSETAFRLENMP